MYTPSGSHINNFAANVSYSAKTGDASWKLGGGYLNGGVLGSDGVRSGDRIAVWDFNGKVSMGNFDVLGEYVQTAKAITGSCTVGAFTVSNKKLKGWNIGADYNMPVMGKASVINAGYSELRTASNEYARQYVIGFRNETFSNVWMGVEYKFLQVKDAIDESDTSRSHQIVLNVTGVF